MILDGVRVLDFTQYLAGPAATRLMTELGAETVKVELAPDGDPCRILPIVKDGRSAYFLQQNMGKLSICLDKRKPEYQEIFRDLVANSDIVIENFSKRAAENNGLAYESLKKINPSVIVASVSAFGRTGPYAHKTGYDWIAQAFSGLMHMTGPRDGSPQPVGIAIADTNAGVHAFAAVGYALYYREKTGEGQYLDISMVDALFHMNDITLQGYAVSDGAYQPMRAGAHHPLLCPCGVYKATDGYMALLVLQNQWGGLCEAMGRADLESDPRFIDQDARAKNQEELIPVIEAWLQTFASDDAAWACLEEHRVPSAPVMDPKDTIDHEYFVGRGAIRVASDDVLGEVPLPGFPLRFSAQPEYPARKMPLLGEHNRQILKSVLGYEDARISALEAAGVLVAKQS